MSEPREKKREAGTTWVENGLALICYCVFLKKFWTTSLEVSLFLLLVAPAGYKRGATDFAVVYAFEFFLLIPTE